MPVCWRTITFASVAMIMIIYGQTAGVSVFVDPLIEELVLPVSVGIAAALVAPPRTQPIAGAPSLGTPAQ